MAVYILKKKFIGSFAAVSLLYMTKLNVFASSTYEVQSKLKQGASAIQGVLTGLAVAVGVIATIKVVIKALPNLDDPHIKDSMWRSVGSIFLGVAAMASVTWLAPWIFGLFA